jgi:hypothetical protein
MYLALSTGNGGLLMFTWFVKGLMALGTSIFIMPGIIYANSSQPIDKNSKYCAQQTRYQEQNHGIPRHLLTAISHTESGRWSKSEQAIVAWPWTVTSGSTGRFFDTKEEAMAEVEFLMTEGVRNIDVGCMQINMHYHADAFETLSDAFDPKQNTAYAAKFLSKLKTSSNSWMDAAGTYHSSTPDKKAYYQSKVSKYWNAERGFASHSTPPATPRAVAPVSNVAKEIDHARMAQLNTAFRNRQQRSAFESTQINKVQQRAKLRQREMLEWQNARARGKNIAHLLAAQRAQQHQRQRKKFAAMGQSKFPDKRKNQLKKWREKGIWSGG